MCPFSHISQGIYCHAGCVAKRLLSAGIFAIRNTMALIIRTGCECGSPLCHFLSSELSALVYSKSQTCA